MKRIGSTLLLAGVALIPALSQNPENPFVGRWDLTVTAAGVKYGSWLEVTEKAGKLDARAQQRTGHAQPVAGVRREGQRLLVTVMPAVSARPAEGKRPAIEARAEIVWDLTEKGGKLSGVSKQGKDTWQIEGVRAPALKRAAPAQWGAPEPLFNGKDLTGWQPVNNTPEAVAGRYASHWTVKSGELTNTARGSNLRTSRTFDDFKLHVEYNCPPDENSGIYLRGRYELQVGPAQGEAVPTREAVAKRGPGGSFPNQFGFVSCVYGMAGPASLPPFKPDWQVFDVTMIGRMVTAVFNGVTTVNNQEIAGITGGALDSNEGEPGPIYLQGDHHGGIRYRNITISLPKK